MYDLKLTEIDPGQVSQLSPVALAFIGDGVFELLVRERLLGKGTLPAHLLHRKAVSRVNAVAQAAAYDALEAELDDEERAVLRRGRNAHTAKVPKSCSPADYRKATAIEALFGYLYLKGENHRVAALYAIVERVQDALEAAAPTL